MRRFATALCAYLGLIQPQAPSSHLCNVRGHILARVRSDRDLLSPELSPEVRISAASGEFRKNPNPRIFARIELLMTLEDSGHFRRKCPYRFRRPLHYPLCYARDERRKIDGAALPVERKDGRSPTQAAGRRLARQTRKPSTTIGMTETMMIARMTSLKFFCTNGWLPKR
jgi:hypothetical protein